MIEKGQSLLHHPPRSEGARKLQAPHTVAAPVGSLRFSQNAHDFLALGPSAGRKEASAPICQAWARALMVLEHHGVKQPAASQPTAASRPQRRRSCFGSRNAIFSMMPEHLNDGWRTTVVDVPAASGALSTPTPTPSPLTISPSSRQASMLLQLNLIELEEAPTTWARDGPAGGGAYQAC